MLAKREFQLTSPAEVSQVLFNELKLPYPEDQHPNPNKSRNRRVVHSTRGEILQCIMDIHPLPAIVLEHRKLSHTINSYIDNLPKFSFFNQK